MSSSRVGDGTLSLLSRHDIFHVSWRADSVSNLCRSLATVLSLLLMVDTLEDDLVLSSAFSDNRKALGEGLVL